MVHRSESLIFLEADGFDSDDFDYAQATNRPLVKTTNNKPSRMHWLKHWLKQHAQVIIKGISAPVLLAIFLGLSFLCLICLRDVGGGSANLGSVCEKCCFCTRDMMTADLGTGTGWKYRGAGKLAHRKKDQDIVWEFALGDEGDEDSIPEVEGEDLEIVIGAWKLFEATPENVMVQELEGLTTGGAYLNLARFLLEKYESNKQKDENTSCMDNCCYVKTYPNMSENYKKLDEGERQRAREYSMVRRLLWKKDSLGLMLIKDECCKNPTFIGFGLLLIMAWFGAVMVVIKSSQGTDNNTNTNKSDGVESQEEVLRRAKASAKRSLKRENRFGITKVEERYDCFDGESDDEGDSSSDDEVGNRFWGEHKYAGNAGMTGALTGGF